MGVKRSRGLSLSSAEDPSSPFSREQSVDIKLVHIDTESAAAEQHAVMKCLLPPHEPMGFASYEEYDVHYQKMHTNRCSDTAPKRRMHCVDKHQFPKNYDFFIINDGIDRRNSMLRPTHRRRSSTMSSATVNASDSMDLLGF
ncbi:hypothetical protein E8E12_008917 [Didymella heteroderae]|uniref:Uncharacterized protein n=1 Tax=Didymella heteroderae TaxID=1769908 RepID=A0A9P5C0K8_9PLEO|nr:hypothetical protein E8E12_008917 [Didymella heteroderae]